MQSSALPHCHLLASRTPSDSTGTSSRRRSCKNSSSSNDAGPQGPTSHSSSPTSPSSSAVNAWRQSARLFLFSLLFLAYCCASAEGFSVREQSVRSYQSTPTSSNGDQALTEYQAYKLNKFFDHPLYSPCSWLASKFYCDSRGGKICYKKVGVAGPLCKCNNCHSGTRCELESFFCAIEQLTNN